MTSPDCSVLVYDVEGGIVVRRCREWRHVLCSDNRWRSISTTKWKLRSSTATLLVTRCVDSHAGLIPHSRRTSWRREFDVNVTWFQHRNARRSVTTNQAKPSSWSSGRLGTSSAHRQYRRRVGITSDDARTWSHRGAICWLSVVEQLVTQPPGQQLDDDDTRQDAGHHHQDSSSRTPPLSADRTCIPSLTVHHHPPVNARQNENDRSDTYRQAAHFTRVVTCRRRCSPGQVGEITACSGLRTTSDTTVMYFSCYSHLYSTCFFLQACSDAKNLHQCRIITDRVIAWKVKQSVSSVRPSVCPSVYFHSIFWTD